MSPIEMAQAVIDTITQDIKRVNGRSVWVLLKALAILMGTLLIAFIIAGNIRLYIAVTFQNDALNTTTSLSTSLLTLLLIGQVARWAERRWSGFALLKRLFGLLIRMNNLQNLIADAQKGDADAMNALDEAAQTTWHFYTEIVDSVGLPAPVLQDS